MTHTDMQRSTLARVAVLAVALALGAGCRPEQVRRGPLAGAAPQAAGGDAVYVASDEGRIVAVGRDGRQAWVYSMADALAAVQPGASPDLGIREIGVGGDGSVLLVATSETGSTAGLSYLASVSADGKPRWFRQVATPSEVARPMAVGRDVYLAGDDGVLHAYAAADGNELWMYSVSGAALGSPQVGGDGTIFVRGANGKVHAVTPEGRQLWVFEPK